MTTTYEERERRALQLFAPRPRSSSTSEGGHDRSPCGHARQLREITIAGQSGTLHSRWSTPNASRASPTDERRGPDIFDQAKPSGAIVVGAHDFSIDNFAPRLDHATRHLRSATLRRAITHIFAVPQRIRWWNPSLTTKRWATVAQKVETGWRVTRTGGDVPKKRTRMIVRSCGCS